MRKLTFTEAQHLQNCVNAGLSNEPYPFNKEDYEILHQLITDATLHDYDKALKDITSSYIKRINPTVVEWEPKSASLYFYTSSFSNDTITLDNEFIKTIHILCEEYRTFTHTPIWCAGKWLFTK